MLWPQLDPSWNHLPGCQCERINRETIEQWLLEFDHNAFRSRANNLKSEVHLNWTQGLRYTNFLSNYNRFSHHSMKFIVYYCWLLGRLPGTAVHREHATYNKARQEPISFNSTRLGGAGLIECIKGNYFRDRKWVVG